MSKLGDKLREIIGQETDPPLWIYVTKNQIPILLRAAEALDRASDAWIDGACFGVNAAVGRCDVAALFVRKTT